jgi:hypothetical protein
MKINEVIPIAVSILVIILVALLERYSKLFAALTATMPLTLPLAFWVVYSSSQGDQAAVENFARSLVIGMIPTMGFSLALWWAARQSWKIGPLMALAYAVWGLVLFVLVVLRRIMG